MGVAKFESGREIDFDGVRHRIIRKLPGKVWHLEDVRTGRWRELDQSSIEQKIAEGTISFPGSGWIAQPSNAKFELPEKDHEKAKMRLPYVLATLHVPNSRRALEAAITEVWEKAKLPANRPGHISVYQWKHRYMASSNDIRSLADNTAAKGNRKPRFPKIVTEICQEALETRYMCREKPTLRTALEHAMLQVKDYNAALPASCRLPMPTRRLLTGMLAKIPARDVDSARKGRDKARHEYRSKKGHVVTFAPLERVEMDHTILDIFVIDEHTMMPLGRPHITACIDDYTRCVLGIYISFTPPSALVVAKCLKHCFLPKSQLKSDYPEINSEWAAHGVMFDLVVDHGLDFHSRKLEGVCESLGISLTFSPRKEPWFKPIIERFVGTLNRGVAHGTPGTTFSNIFEKGDYDPLKHAVVTLTTLKKMVHKWIADVYHQELHRGLKTSPSQMWAQSIRFADIRRPDDTTNLDAIMGTSHRRTLTHSGIEFQGLFYNSPELTEFREIHGPKLDVEARVDESNLGTIYVDAKGLNRPLLVPCLSPEYASGMSLWQHKVMREWQRKNAAMANDITGWMEAKRAIRGMVEQDIFSKKSTARKKAARYLQDVNNKRDGDGNFEVRVSAPTPNLRKADEKAIEREHFAPLSYPSKRIEVPETLDRKPRLLTPITRKEISNGVV